ncbi:5'-nucleotidase domain-containing protein 1-like [Actinia tenebrosa]|uniref:5'-nucleotidase domain-containing protein 1-like n=1 Tax=Actinia tenebrosa TaxID=6105 RepID=A0A6P8ILZ0_ACTTE|nr:5'-nucleotidase domain-containing protein 1-like [Actinia tenebrosa]
MVKISDYDCIGFDLDHTVIQYKLSNLYTLTYKFLTTFLVKEKGYDASLLDSSLEDHKDFILRGLILDADKGNLIKLDKHGCILRASHGTTPMSDKEILDCYGEKRKFLLFEELKSSMIKRHRHISSFRIFETFFDLPAALVAAKLVDVIDAKSGRPEKYTFWPDIMEAFILNFSPSSFTGIEILNY